MAPASKEGLLKLVNASGFLFQLRVEDEINKTASIHGKTILSKEHKWIDETKGEEGFIDLIVTTGTNGKMIVECKRVMEGTWFFLMSKDAAMAKEANVLWSYQFEDGRQVAAWDKLRLNPESMESSFCIVRGQGEKDQPMLERISDVLLRSTECLAAEEHNYHRVAGLRGVRFYFPVIITTAKLKACKCDFSKVDLSTGQIPDADFEDVPFIRFTKSMPTQLASSNHPKDVSESNRESQRTVFIFNANNLAATLLSTWEFDEPKYSTDLWPWELSLWKKEKYNNSIRND